MPNDTMHFSVEKVKALRAYFLRMRNGSRGTPECADHDTALKLCEQLIAVMQAGKPQKEQRHGADAAS
jgi:hypothetical protein